MLQSCQGLDVGLWEITPFPSPIHAAEWCSFVAPSLTAKHAPSKVDGSGVIWVFRRGLGQSPSHCRSLCHSGQKMSTRCINYLKYLKFWAMPEILSTRQESGRGLQNAGDSWNVVDLAGLIVKTSVCYVLINWLTSFDWNRLHQTMTLFLVSSWLCGFMFCSVIWRNSKLVLCQLMSKWLPFDNIFGCVHCMWFMYYGRRNQEINFLDRVLFAGHHRFWSMLLLEVEDTDQYNITNQFVII
jgi:hypothetical protein